MLGVRGDLESGPVPLAGAFAGLPGATGVKPGPGEGRTNETAHPSRVFWNPF